MRFFGRLRLTYPTHVACTCRVRLSALCRSFSLSRSVPRFFRCPFAPLYPGGFNVHESFATFDGIRATRRRPGTMTSRPAGAWKITFPLYHYADFFCHFVIPPTTLSRRHMAKRREVDERARTTNTSNTSNSDNSSLPDHQQGSKHEYRFPISVSPLLISRMWYVSTIISVTKRELNRQNHWKLRVIACVRLGISARWNSLGCKLCKG